MDTSTGGKRLHLRSTSNQRKFPPHYYPPQTEASDYDTGYARVRPRKGNSRVANRTDYPSQYPLRRFIVRFRKDAIRSRIHTIYNSKKAITASNFFKQKRTHAGLASFMAKYTLPQRLERLPPPSAEGITIDQYFAEMETRCPSLLRHTGKRCASTAVPARRPHTELAPLNLRLSRVPQVYHESRPDSRYNHDSICSSLEGAMHARGKWPVPSASGSRSGWKQAPIYGLS